MAGLDAGTLLYPTGAAAADSARAVAIAASRLLVRGTDMIVMADATAGNVVLTLPDPTTHADVWFFIKRVDGTLTTYVELLGAIDFGAGLRMGLPNENLSVMSNGVEWKVMTQRSANFGTISYLNAAPTTQTNITTTPQLLTAWDTNEFETPGVLVPDFTASKVTVAHFDNPTRDGYRFIFSVAAQFQNNIDVDFEVYVDGSPTGIGTGFRGNGANTVLANINIPTAVDAPAPKDISIFVFASSGSNTLTVCKANLTLEKIGL